MDLKKCSSCRITKYSYEFMRTGRSASNKKTCNNCINTKTEIMNKRISEGNCGKCGIEPLVSKTKCQNCLDLDKKNTKLRNIERKANNLCCHCGEEPLANATAGVNCILKRAASDYLTNDYSYLDLKKMLEQQNYKCALCCDEDLVLGKNAHVGHKTANARVIQDSSLKGKGYKGYKKVEVGELYWLCKLCNKYQDQYSYHEFLEICKMFYINNTTNPCTSYDHFALHHIKIYKHYLLQTDLQDRKVA